MSDILAAIDAAVEQRCACGCGEQLDPDGPSAWFVSPECQRRYHEAGTTDPEAVLSRPDAAFVHPGLDGAEVPLEPRGAPSVGRALESIRNSLLASIEDRRVEREWDLDRRGIQPLTRLPALQP